MISIRITGVRASGWFAGSLLALSFVSPSPALADAQSFAVRQVRLFDGERLHPRMTVIVREGLIHSVEADSAVPGGMEVVEGTGRTLLPGLFDSHAHSRSDTHALRQMLAFGVTTVLDMGTGFEWAAERRAEQRRGPVTARADVLSAGNYVTSPRGHGTQFGRDVMPIASADEAEAAVETRLRQGSDYIKIIYTPPVCERCMPSIDSTTMRVVIEETHRRDRMAVVHVGMLDDARTAVRAGADGLVHLFSDRMADADFLELIQERGTFVIPTLTILAAFGGVTGADDLSAHPRFYHYLDAEDIKRLIYYNPRGRESRFFQFDSVTASLRMLAQRGVPILAGSDPPNNGTAWGASLHRELELLVQAGLSPTAALRAATSEPAFIFDLDDRGRIAPGLRADLLLVEGDPTEDILSTRDIVAIWKHGVRFDREAYRESLDSGGD